MGPEIVAWIIAGLSVVLAGVFARAWSKAVAEKHKAELALERDAQENAQSQQALKDVDEAQAKAASKLQQADAKLIEISGLTADQAKRQVIEAAGEAADTIIEAAETKGEDAATSRLLTAMQRMAGESAHEGVTTVVQLQNDAMKGRLIGREGRNIKAFEQTTGVDLIVDDTPEAVILSSFDPERREAARMTLEALMLDGRIHPQRIEELHAESIKTLPKSQIDAGRDAAQRAGVAGLNDEVLTAMGALRFRQSWSQNVLEHLVEAAQIAQMVAGEAGVDVESARKAAFLHDVGKGLGPEWEGPHAVAGMNFLSRHLNDPAILNAVGAHHDDIKAEHPEAAVVIIADTLSSARPGARRENPEHHLNRLSHLEGLVTAISGVKSAYALKAGREIRVIVDSDAVTDEGADRIAKQAARRIRQENGTSGSVKVTVIREVRAVETTD
jgi:ribonuclease Y